MSYILLAWEQPTPSSMEEVGPIVLALRADHALDVNARVDAFMGQLWKTFPRDLDGDDADYVWDDSFPWRPQPRPKLIYLNISFAHVDEVTPIVLKVAREFGIVVYDSEIQTVFLPTGEFLGIPPQPPRLPVAKTFTAKAASQEFLSVAATLLKPHGFKWKKFHTWDSRFVRKFDGGWQSLRPVINGDDVETFIDWQISAFLDAADGLQGEKTGSKGAADVFVASKFLKDFVAETDFSGGLKSFKYIRHMGFFQRSMAEIERFAQQSVEMLVSEILPRLDVYRSLESFGAHIQVRRASHEKVFFSEPAAVRIAAVAAGAPDVFEEISGEELALVDQAAVELESFRSAHPVAIANARAIRDRIASVIDQVRPTNS